MCSRVCISKSFSAANELRIYTRDVVGAVRTVRYDVLLSEHTV